MAKSEPVYGARFRPLLAATLENSDLDGLNYSTLLGSPKFDGIRAVVDQDYRLLSRKLKEIPNRDLRSLFGESWLWGVDGELICGDPTSEDCYQRTQSAVMSHESPDSKQVKFYLFDYFGSGFDIPYYERRDRLINLVWSLPAGLKRRVVVVDQTPVSSRPELDRFERDNVAQGYEGIMLRSSTARYKRGRSTLTEACLMKFKRFVDGECRVLAVRELEVNMNEAKTNELGFSKRSSAKAGKVRGGTLGGFRVVDLKSGIEFDIGTGLGLTAELRAELWEKRKSLVGQLIKYRYQTTGVKERPRFPRFLGFRDPIDVI